MREKLVSSLCQNSFYSIADFFVRFTSLSERKVSQVKRKNPTFRRAGRGKMISLQDSAGIRYKAI